MKDILPQFHFNLNLNKEQAKILSQVFKQSLWRIVLVGGCRWLWPGCPVDDFRWSLSGGRFQVGSVRRSASGGPVRGQVSTKSTHLFRRTPLNCTIFFRKLYQIVIAKFILSSWLNSRVSCQCTKQMLQSTLPPGTQGRESSQGHIF